MVSSDIRKEARVSLKGKWGKGALITLVYGLITYAMQLIASLIPIIGLIALIVIEVPIAYGIIVSFMKLKRGEEVSVVDFLTDGFKSFGRAWGVTGNILLKLIVPIIIAIVLIVLAMVGMSMTTINSLTLSSSSSAVSAIGTVLVIVGIIGYIVAIIDIVIKSLYYVLSMFVLRDHEELTGKEIVEKSEELMKGNRWSYVWLFLTFIGWAILACFTLGIGMFWLIPYVQVAQIIFYEDRAGKLNEKKDSEPEVIEEK